MISSGASVLVPNVPCGVEIISKGCLEWGKREFLMYRVELKSLCDGV